MASAIATTPSSARSRGSAAEGSTAEVVPKPQSSAWILNRWLDLLLFVGTPALLIPIFALAQRRWSAQDIFLFVGAFGAMGHHLPGMIRAYGDRALFTRFKIRFIVAPIALLGVCIWSSFYNVQAIQLVALSWGIWHGLMQTYGFCRIYDSKASAKAPSRARIDFALCVIWFSAAVLLSPLRFRSCLELYYESGGPAIPAVAFTLLRNSLIALLISVTAIFLWRQWRDSKARAGFSATKIALLTSSIAFWWYCNNGVQNLLVGIALFEVFHDVQYLSIVWIYNRARVEKDQSIQGFMRFVFRRSGSLIGVYVGLVLAYGGIGLVTSGVSADSIRYTLVGLVTASALLHFYYDGFIWKVRESHTRSNLGIGGNESNLEAKSRRRLPLWTVHSLRWAALIIPFAILCSVQLQGRGLPLMDRAARVLEVLPKNAMAHLNYGKALLEADQPKRAMEHFSTALELDPALAEADFLSATVSEQFEDWTQAQLHYERALASDSRSAKSEANLASLLQRQGDSEQAKLHNQRALAINPKMEVAHKNLADLLMQDGDFNAAITHYKEALRLTPDDGGARDSLRFAESFSK